MRPNELGGMTYEGTEEVDTVRAYLNVSTRAERNPATDSIMARLALVDDVLCLDLRQTRAVDNALATTMIDSFVTPEQIATAERLVKGSQGADFERGKSLLERNFEAIFQNRLGLQAVPDTGAYNHRRTLRELDALARSSQLPKRGFRF